MNIYRLYILSLIVCWVFPGCITGPGASGNLGTSNDRRVVIVGEKVSADIARILSAPV